MRRRFQMETISVSRWLRQVVVLELDQTAASGGRLKWTGGKVSGC